MRGFSKALLVGVLGVGLGFGLFLQSERLREMLDWAFSPKPECADPGFLELWRISRAWSREEDEYSDKVHLVNRDPGLRIAQYEVGGERYWIPVDGQEMEGSQLLSYLLVEHQWMEKLNPNEQVKSGDVVIDCGAHVGVFSRAALRRGASKVLAIEPAPLNLECLRRNLESEVQAGRVVIVAKGAWDSEGVMRFGTSKRNSGNNSMVFKADRAEEVTINVTTLDSVVVGSGLPKVDYIKMDIEGAERRALVGARSTLSVYRPVLALEFYHLKDDPVVLPEIVRSANGAYRQILGPCFNGDGQGWRPHVVYFR